LFGAAKLELGDAICLKDRRDARPKAEVKAEAEVELSLNLNLNLNLLESTSWGDE
jgi:hypothetical protein